MLEAVPRAAADEQDVGVAGVEIDQQVAVRAILILADPRFVEGAAREGREATRHEGANVGKRVALEHVTSGARLAWSGFTSLRDKVLQHDTYHGIPRMLEAAYSALREGGRFPVSPADMTSAAQLTDRLVGLGRS